MKIAFRNVFFRDLKKLRDLSLVEDVQKVIGQVKIDTSPQEIKGLKKLSGTVDAYRIRVGDHRIGVYIRQETVVIARCLHRRDFYRFFP